MWVPQEELLRVPAASCADSIPTGFHSQKLWGLIFLALESWAGGPGGRSPPYFYFDIPLVFYSYGCGTSPFCIYAPPTSLDGCGFFNSVVVRLPFNSISDGSE